jgi:hypothetical protein
MAMIRFLRARESSMHTPLAREVYTPLASDFGCGDRSSSIHGRGDITTN